MKLLANCFGSAVTVVWDGGENRGPASELRLKSRTRDRSAEFAPRAALPVDVVLKGRAILEDSSIPSTYDHKNVRTDAGMFSSRRASHDEVIEPVGAEVRAYPRLTTTKCAGMEQRLAVPSARTMRRRVPAEPRGLRGRENFTAKKMT